MPTVVTMRTKRPEDQADERAAAPVRKMITYE
jgi:hypothetical protein